MTPKIFTLNTCSYCHELKKKLGDEGIDYDEYDADEYEDLFFKLSDKADSDQVPMVVVGKKLLAPEVSFKTIDEAVTYIKKFLEQND